MNFYNYAVDYQNHLGQEFNQHLQMPYLVFDRDEEFDTGMAIAYYLRGLGYVNISCISIRFSRPISLDELTGYGQQMKKYKYVRKLMKSSRIIIPPRELVITQKPIIRDRRN